MKSKLTMLLLVVMVCLTNACKKDASTSNNNATTTDAGKYLLFDEDPIYTSGKSTIPALYTSLFYTNLAGSNPIQLTFTPTGYFDYRSSFSFDGKQVIFIRGNTDDTDRSLCIINFDGTNLRTITKGDEVDYASFSPDATQVAYAKSLISSVPYHYEIYTANIDGSNEKKITSYAQIGSTSNISWSKNGKIYFSADGTNTFSAGIYSMNTDGSNMILIKSSSGLLSISPDSKYLAYETATGLYYCNADGSNSKLIKSFTSEFIGNPPGVAWSKDDKQLYFASFSNTQQLSGMYKINIDGSGLTELFSGYFEIPNIF
jgi:Tol biopolymer transport system component